MPLNRRNWFFFPLASLYSVERICVPPAQLEIASRLSAGGYKVLFDENHQRVSVYCYCSRGESRFLDFQSLPPGATARATEFN